MSRDAQQRLTREEYQRALRVLRMILPMSMRKTGNFHDPAHWFERGEFDLGRIAAPTLVVHFRDDTFVSFGHGQHTAAGIPQAWLAPQEFRGHFVYVRDAVLRKSGRSSTSTAAFVVSERCRTKTFLLTMAGMQSSQAGHCAWPI